ncbi:MAG: winged helix-turn-helix transcriptional regulator [Anaerolineae bacterium]|nr:winged helix-turn-helix transcriptional regulator [Anaerolineae bacterium]
MTDPHKAAQAQRTLLTAAPAGAVANLFKALADPTRVRIISALLHTDLCVNDLTALLGMKQSAVSHQLRTLREWRLVQRERRGRLMYYHLDDDHVRDLLLRSLEHVLHD